MNTTSDPYHIIGYEAAQISTPFEDFVEALADWESYVVMSRGKIAGIIYHKGPEIHACILPEYRRRWFSRKIIKELVGPLFQVYGHLLTSVPDNKPWGHDFVQKFGFVKDRRGSDHTLYRLENLKWA